MSDTPSEDLLNQCREEVARLWCLPTTQMIEMDSRLAEAMAHALAAERARTKEALNKVAEVECNADKWAMKADSLAKQLLMERDHFKAEVERLTKERDHQISIAQDAYSETLAMDVRLRKAEKKSFELALSIRGLLLERQVLAMEAEKEVATARADAIHEMVDLVAHYWSFDEKQQHTHSWHEKQYALDKMLEYENKARAQSEPEKKPEERP